MQQYKILGADDKAYGPVTAEVLQQWITQGRANAMTSVQIEGVTEWKPLSSFPELAQALTQFSPPPLPNAPELPGIETTVKTSRMAIASLICGILGFLCFPAVAGLVLGIIALVLIGRSEGRLKGKGIAIAGIVVSCLMLMVAIPATVIFYAPSPAQQEQFKKNQPNRFGDTRGLITLIPFTVSQYSGAPLSPISTRLHASRSRCYLVSPGLTFAR
jgi:hypothetical protein